MIHSVRVRSPDRKIYQVWLEGGGARLLKMKSDVNQLEEIVTLYCTYISNVYEA